MKYKEGLKTSELWVTVIGVGSIIWASVQQQCNLDVMVWLGVAGAIATYVWSRTVLKKK